MAFIKKSAKQNYDILSGYSWYVPGVSGMFALLGMLLFGALLGNVLTLCLLPLGQEAASEYGMIIAYPVMFIPAMIYAKMKSNHNAMFEVGYHIDSNHYGQGGVAVTALLCMLATMGLAFIMDAVNSLMPPMPEGLEALLSSMTEGNFFLNFLSVSIFAPFFEEWLCRGMVLRGLLNYKREDGSQMKPAAAIVISALFFAGIHLNPWQAVPAFAIGCLMGYVYYKTGSLKLTMLMHFANNTLALCIGQSESLKDYDSWMDILPGAAYWGIAAVCAAVIYYVAACHLGKIKTQREAGNSDEIPVEDPISQL